MLCLFLIERSIGYFCNAYVCFARFINTFKIGFNQPTVFIVNTVCSVRNSFKNMLCAGEKKLLTAIAAVTWHLKIAMCLLCQFISDSFINDSDRKSITLMCYDTEISPHCCKQMAWHIKWKTMFGFIIYVFKRTYSDRHNSSHPSI